MIVRDIMNTQLVTVEGDDTVCHAATLFRHYQFHHLPVVRTIATAKEAELKHTLQSPPIHILEGLITSQDIEFAYLSPPSIHRRYSCVCMSKALSILVRTNW